MAKFWELSEEHQRHLIESKLEKYGKVIGALETPYSMVYTLQGDVVKVPRFVVAKAPKVDAAMADDQIRVRLLRFLHEVNHIYRTCHLSLIHRFGQIEIAYGLPFLISAKRHMTLRDAMEEGPLNVVTALAIAVQVSHAIAYIGKKGISAHQDLKAENIFLDDVTKKFRFGDVEPPYRYQAYVADLDMANAAILFNKPQGSRPYMAPEQYEKSVDGAPPVSLSRADVFAVGVNLFEMLTGGLHPLGERTTDVWPGRSGKWSHEEVWKNWARNAANRLKQHSGSMDGDLTALMISCFQPEPGNRPCAGDLETALLSCLRSRDNGAHESLKAYLAQVDEDEAIGSDAGWPHMDDMYSRLQQQLL